MNNKVQEQYLLQAIASTTPVALYLINGIKLSGVITHMDDEAIILNDNNGTVSQLIYKHAISTIVPKK